MAKKLNIEVTNKYAVYVNGTRVTGRDTKWGVQNTIFKTTTTSKDVTQTLADYGYGFIKLDKIYLTELGLS